jgi:hypothetical protein
MALKHHVAFVVPVRTIAECYVTDHFHRLGYALEEGGPGEWRFRRGSKLATLWRFDIRAYATDLVVRVKAQPDGTSWVSCDFEVWTFLTLVLSGDIATLDAEARELESILRQHAVPETEAEHDGLTSTRSRTSFSPPDLESRKGALRRIRAERGAAPDQPRD